MNWHRRFYQLENNLKNWFIREIQMKEFSVKLYDLNSRIEMIYSIIKDTNNNIYKSIKDNINGN